MLRAILVSITVLVCATVGVFVQVDRATAAVSCPKLPHNFLLTAQVWNFDTDLAICQNTLTLPQNGFTLLSSEQALSFNYYSTGNTSHSASNPGSAANAGVTNVNLSPTDVASGVSAVDVVDTFTYKLVMKTATSAGVQTYTATITKAGISYTIIIVGEFNINLNGGIQSITSITITGGVFGDAVTTGASESTNLDNQQSFFTTLIMNQQSGNMISGVGSNLDSLFNGNGLASLVSMSGFSFQSTGANKWREKQGEALEANNPKTALDILASQSRASQNRNSDGTTKADTTSNLMAYASGKDNASSETVEKLNAVAKDDIYAADITPSDEIGLNSPWNAWVKGSWSVYQAHDSAAFDGHMVDVVGGVDYRLSDDLIIGVLGGYGMADFDTLTSGTTGSFDADGIHAGVYLGKRLAPNLLLDALVAYTSTDYDNRSGTTTGSFNAHRVTFAAHLKGNIDWGMITMQPTIGLMYSSEKQDGYTDSATVVHASKTVTAGRLSIGPKFIFQPITTDFGTTQFWFAAKGEYDFSNQNTSATSSLPDISDIASARVQGGLNVSSDSGVSLSLQGDVSGLGSGEFIAYGGTVKVSVPF